MQEQITLILNKSEITSLIENHVHELRKDIEIKSITFNVESKLEGQGIAEYPVTQFTGVTIQATPIVFL